MQGPALSAADPTYLNEKRCINLWDTLPNHRHAMAFSVRNLLLTLSTQKRFIPGTFWYFFSSLFSPANTGNIVCFTVSCWKFISLVILILKYTDIERFLSLSFDQEDGSAWRGTPSHAAGEASLQCPLPPAALGKPWGRGMKLGTSFALGELLFSTS